MEVALDQQGSTAKIRNPVLVAIFTVITLGIYGIYWWYQINREMVDYGRNRQTHDLGDNPTMSLLAIFPGGLIIVPAIISMINTVGRIGRAQEISIGRRTMNGWVVLGVILGGIIIPFLGLVAYGYMQAELNKVWENVQRGDAQLGSGYAADPYAAPQAAPDPYAAPQAPPPPPPPPPTS
jgi:uncharacterized protein DUF4234